LATGGWGVTIGEGRAAPPRWSTQGGRRRIAADPLPAGNDGVGPAGGGLVARSGSRPGGQITVNKAAHEAIERSWALTVKARALCPYTDDSAIGIRGYLSPPWYRQRGAIYFVNLAEPITREDVSELNEVGLFINRSFVIAMASILEAFDVVPYGQPPNRSKAGGDHAQLTKWLRHRFAHGDWEFDPTNEDHIKTRALLERLFPVAAKKGRGVLLAIDEILEPLKDGVLKYVRACA
jgi:hypothetical protein